MHRRQSLTLTIVGLLLLLGGDLGWAGPGGLPQCIQALHVCNTNLSSCMTDEATCDTKLAACLAALPMAFPATGQTSCWDVNFQPVPCAGTGHDGDIRAGAVLSYTDNGDGTITDNNTGLMWEKKSNDRSIHNQDLVYFWDDAFAVHIAQLNATAFAGHTDWRLPNVKELQSIVNYERSGRAVSPAFDTGCFAASCTVLTCSCTSGTYWTSTVLAPGTIFEYQPWAVDFGFGTVKFYDGESPTGDKFHVRAVRGGL